MNSNDTRRMIKYMRGKATPQKLFNESKPKDLSIREMLSITRNRRISESQLPLDVAPLDQKTEEERMNNFFRGEQVTIKYEPLIMYRNAVMFSGNIDDQINFVFTVTPDDTKSKPKYEFQEDFDESNPENQEIINKLDAYYDEFYRYWRDEKLNL